MVYRVTTAGRLDAAETEQCIRDLAAELAARAQQPRPQRWRGQDNTSC
jgi:hypothetical protein